MRRLLPWCLLLFLPLQAAPRWQRRVQALMASKPAARMATWGIEVADTASGKPLYQWNAHKLLTPASNVKLLTTALALTRLGPDYRVATSVVREGDDLVLVGRGDANLSGRPMPYDPHGKPGDPLKVIDDLAAQVAAAGVKQVAGNIVGDDRAFDYEPIPEGWSHDDALNDDGAAVSALCVNDNVMHLLLTAAGGVPRAELVPALPVFEVVNRLRVGSPQKIFWTRETGAYRLLLSGALAPGAAEDIALSVGDPARFAAIALRESLLRHGVEARGAAVARHVYPGEWEPGAARQPEAGSPALATHPSAPLLDDLRVTDKVSQNLHAEVLLRTVALQMTGHGSLSAGLEALRAFLDGLGIAREEFDVHDGSGLSRQDLLTPAALVTLLQAMRQSPQAEAWRSLLPISGLDGSLRERLDRASEGRVVAKTGSLTHVAALSGYARTKAGRELTFSIIVNHYHGPGAEVRAVIDQMLRAMVE